MAKGHCVFHLAVPSCGLPTTIVHHYTDTCFPALVTEDCGAGNGHHSAASRVWNAPWKQQDHLRVAHQGTGSRAAAVCSADHP